MIFLLQECIRILHAVTSALAWGESGGHPSSLLPRGIDDVANAAVIVSHAIIIIFSYLTYLSLHQMIKELDSWTDGEGIRAVDGLCDQTRRRYADFRQATIHLLRRSQEEQPDQWDLFMDDVRCASIRAPLPYSYDELNSLSAS